MAGNPPSERALNPATGSRRSDQAIPDVSWVLRAEGALERPLAMARLAVAQSNAAVAAPRYLKALERALADELPPFATPAYAELFRAAAQGGQWLVIWLMRGAEEKGRFARRLWSQAAQGAGEAQLLKRHAVDESNHVRAYLNLLDVLFPSAVPAELRRDIVQLVPRFTMRQKMAADVGDDGEAEFDVADWISTNLSELRMAVRLMLFQAAISPHCPLDRFEHAAPLFESLMRDEVRHIGYSAEIIENKLRAENAMTVTAALLRGMRAHVRATSEDALDYTYHVRFGNYP